MYEHDQRTFVLEAAENDKLTSAGIDVANLAFLVVVDRDGHERTYLPSETDRDSIQPITIDGFTRVVPLQESAKVTNCNLASWMLTADRCYWWTPNGCYCCGRLK